MSDLLVLVAIGVGTYTFRALFLVAGRRSPPRPLARVLPLVGPAVLAAIAMPALIVSGGDPSPRTTGPALVAALVCFLLRRRTGSLPIALFGGLGTGWIGLVAVAALG